MSDFIDDGYEEEGYIAAVDGVHGPLEFKYRPALGKLADKVLALIQGERPNWDAFWAETTKALARDPHLLKSWSETDRHGQPVPITEANLMRVRDVKFHKLWGVVSGSRPSDTRPDGTKPRQPDLEADSKN